MIPFIAWVRERLNRDAAIVVGALVFGALALYVADSYLEHQEAKLRATLTREHRSGTTEVVVASADLPPGSEINESTVAVRSMPSDYVHADAVRPAGFDAVKGRHLDRGLEKGRALLLAFVSDGVNGFSDGIQAGRRALTLNVDEVSSINGLVRPGDRLDLVVTQRDAGQTLVRALLSGVKVLATGSLTSAATPPDTRPSARLGLSYSTITLEVTPAEAEEVILARDTGQVTAMLRRRTGSEPDLPSAPLSSSPLRVQPEALRPGLPGAPRAAPGREIEYILGGRGDGMPQFLRVPVDASRFIGGGAGGVRPQPPLPPQRVQTPPPAERVVVLPAAAAPVPTAVLPGVPLTPGEPYVLNGGAPK